MGQIDNLNKDQAAEIWKAIRELQTAAPNNHSAIGRDGLEVYDGGVITITNGGLKVTGTAEIIGILLASGTINLTGNVTVSGPMDVTGLMQLMNDLAIVGGGKITAGSARINSDGSAAFGSFTIAANGDLTSEGALNIKGPTTLNNDLTVAAGRKIALGGLSLENTGAGGATMNMPGGSVTASSALGLLLLHTASLTLASNVIKLDTLPTISGVTANVYIDPSTKQLKRITP